jgi:hypothetical protein
VCSSRMEGGAVMGTSVSVALAIDLLLTCFAGCLPFLHRVLPLGGSHLAQLGFLVGLAISFTHLWQVFGPASANERPITSQHLADNPAPTGQPTWRGGSFASEFYIRNQ